MILKYGCSKLRAIEENDLDILMNLMNLFLHSILLKMMNGTVC